MIRHVVITGPESSGKSTLATLLGEQLHWPVVDEVARTLLTASGPVYSREDVIRIGLTQLQYNQQMLMQKGRVVADTDLLTIHIWLEDKFGAADESLIQLWLDHIPDLYLLQTPDMPGNRIRCGKIRKEELTCFTGTDPGWTNTPALPGM